MKTLVEMCLADDQVMKYVFKCPAPTAQWARYVDWIYPYVIDVKEQTENARNTYISQSSKVKKELCEALVEMQAAFDEKLAKLKAEEEKEKAGAAPNAFQGLDEHTLDGTGETIPHYPPRYIVGETTQKEEEVAF